MKTINLSQNYSQNMGLNTIYYRIVIKKEFMLKKIYKKHCKYY